MVSHWPCGAQLGPLLALDIGSTAQTHKALELAVLMLVHLLSTLAHGGVCVQALHRSN